MYKKHVFSTCICGQKTITEETIIDCVYPTNREKTQYNAYCNPDYNGCGRIVYANDMNRLEKRWNDGHSDENYFS